MIAGGSSPRSREGDALGALVLQLGLDRDVTESLELLNLASDAGRVDAEKFRQLADPQGSSSRGATCRAASPGSVDANTGLLEQNS